MSKQTHPRPLSLSDRQLHLLQNAARAVPSASREMFLADVAKHLTPEPSDAAVQSAINAMLDRLPSGHFFMTDAKPKEGENK